MHGNYFQICIRDRPGMERIVEITIEHLNELGDTCRKKMVIEIMGKHSNIIFIDEKNMIIDSIKPVSYTHLDVYKRQLSTRLSFLFFFIKL